jgi:hypothetical protein
MSAQGTQRFGRPWGLFVILFAKLLQTLFQLLETCNLQVTPAQLSPQAVILGIELEHGRSQIILAECFDPYQLRRLWDDVRHVAGRNSRLRLPRRLRRRKN